MNLPTTAVPRLSDQAHATWLFTTWRSVALRSLRVFKRTGRASELVYARRYAAEARKYFALIVARQPSVDQAR